VDDESAVREAVAECLAAEGYRVHALGQPAEALEWVRRERPALVLVDLVMPAMSGTELLGRLRADPGLEKVPVVLMTAGIPPRAEPALTPDTVLRKPFDLEDLLATVARFCPPPR
jgi:two-component system phosphate regulon response regulator PhoB